MTELYKVWHATSKFGTFVQTSRLIPTSFRKAEKSQGGANFNVIRSTLVSSSRSDTLYDPKVGDWIRVTYGTAATQADSTNTLWLGRIRSVSKNYLTNSTEWIGSIAAEEVGFWLYDLPLLQFLTEYGNVENPPAFNPSDDSYFYGNLLDPGGGSSIKFLNTNYAKLNKTSPNSKWDEAQKDKVWSLKDVIKYLCSSATSQLSVIIDKGSNAGEGDIADRTIIKSFPSFANQSLGYALDNLIQSPYSYYLNYNVSMGGMDLIIYNTSNATSIYSPSSTVETLAASGAMDIARVDSFKTASKVNVRGNNLLICGSFSRFDDFYPDGGNLLNGWEDNKAMSFLMGSPEANYVNGNEDSAKMIRTKEPGINDVLQLFKFNRYTNGAIIHSDTIGTTASRSEGDTYAFHTRFNFQDDSGASPVYYDTPQAGTKSLTNHATPHEQNHVWSKTLPFFTNNKVPNISAQTWKFVEPFCIFPIWDSTRKEMLWVYADEPHQNGQQSEITLKSNGIKLSSPYPEMFDAQIPEIMDTKYSIPYLDWTSPDAGATPRNPSEYVGPYLSSYGRLIFTAASYSDQKLMMSSTNTSGVNDVTITVDDSSIEAWYIHKGTVLGIDRSVENNLTSLTTMVSGTFIRNDTPILKRMISYYSDFYYSEKNSFKVSWMLPEFNHSKVLGGRWLGTMISTISDRAVTHTSNTSVSSIEWILDDSARVNLSTSFPDVPYYKRLGTNISTGSSTVNLGDWRSGNDKAPVKNATTQQLEKPPEQTLGIQSVAGGSATSEPSLYVSIIGGQASGSGVSCIKYKNALDPVTEMWDPLVDTTDTYPQGLGRGRLYSDGSLVGNVLVRHDMFFYLAPLLRGTLWKVRGTTSIPVSGSEIGTLSAYLLGDFN